jgi:hypothetical protein
MKRLLAMAAVCLLLGCAPLQRRAASPNLPTVGEMHERLSMVIKQDGYRHGVRSERGEEREFDSVFISVPMDAIKRRHESLDQLLLDIASICLAPEFSEYLVLIELASNDAADFEYMKSIIAPLLSGRKNIRIEAGKDTRSDITITMGKPKGR